jgi:hypothetical protein
MGRKFGLGVWLAAIAAAMSGCGGGHSSEEPPPSATYNVDAAYRNLSTAARTFTLTGSATNGTPLTLTWTIAPVSGAATFPLSNVPAKRVDSTLQIRSAATTLVDGGQQAYFDASTMNGLGSLRSDGSCSLATSTTLPTAARVGDKGALGSSVVYATCTTTAPVIGRITGEWSLEQVGATVFLCAHSTLEDAAGAPVSQEMDCVEIDPAGTVGTRARIDVTVNGTVVRFAN